MFFLPLNIQQLAMFSEVNKILSKIVMRRRELAIMTIEKRELQEP